MVFEILIAALALVAGAIASVSGFGIGSLLTPALAVRSSRMHGSRVARWPMLVLLTIAVVVGTIVGTRLLARLPQQHFRRVIGALLIVLGVYMIIAGS